MNDAGLILDIVLMTLLVAALVYGFRLEKKLKALRDSHQGFLAAVRDLDQAAARAEAGLDSLRRSTEEVHDSLHDRVKVGRELTQSLNAQIARAERAAAALDKALAEAPRVEARLEAARAQPPIEPRARREAPRASAPVDGAPEVEEVLELARAVGRARTPEDAEALFAETAGRKPAAQSAATAAAKPDRNPALSRLRRALGESR